MSHDTEGLSAQAHAARYNSTESWSMEFPSSDKSFPNDFMVSLRFWIVDHFELPNCNCQVWNRGIQWSDRNGITNNVEMEKTFKHISLTTTSQIKKEIILTLFRRISTQTHTQQYMVKTFVFMFAFVTTINVWFLEFSSTSTPVNVEVLSAGILFTCNVFGLCTFFSPLKWCRSYK